MDDYFRTALCCIANNELGRILKEAFVVCLKFLSLHFLGGLRKAIKNLSLVISIAFVWPSVGTLGLQNMKHNL